MLTEALATAFFVIGIQLMVPIVLAALGEAITEKSGVLNVGIEGMMLIGAFATAFIGITRGQAILGIVVAVAAGWCSASAGVPLREPRHRPDRHRLDVQHLRGRSDRHAPLAIPRRTKRADLSRDRSSPGSDRSPGSARSSPSRTSCCIWRSFGVRRLLPPQPHLVRAVRRARPVSGRWRPNRVAFMSCDSATRLSSWAVALAALGGSALVLSTSGGFVPGMTAGRGFIALGVVVLAKWRPLWIFVHAFGFGLTQALQFLAGQVPALAFVPTQFWVALPYLITVLAVVFAPGSSYPAAARDPVPDRGHGQLLDPPAPSPIRPKSTVNFPDTCGFDSSKVDRVVLYERALNIRRTKCEICAHESTSSMAAFDDRFVALVAAACGGTAATTTAATTTDHRTTEPRRNHRPATETTAAPRDHRPPPASHTRWH